MLPHVHLCGYAALIAFQDRLGVPTCGLSLAQKPSDGPSRSTTRPVVAPAGAEHQAVMPRHPDVLQGRRCLNQIRRNRGSQLTRTAAGVFRVSGWSLNRSEPDALGYVSAYGELGKPDWRVTSPSILQPVPSEGWLARLHHGPAGTCGRGAFDACGPNTLPNSSGISPSPPAPERLSAP